MKSGLSLFFLRNGFSVLVGLRSKLGVQVGKWSEPRSSGVKVPFFGISCVQWD